MSIYGGKGCELLVCTSGIPFSVKFHFFSMTIFYRNLQLTKRIVLFGSLLPFDLGHPLRLPCGRLLVWCTLIVSYTHIHPFLPLSVYSLFKRDRGGGPFYTISGKGGG